MLVPFIFNVNQHLAVLSNLRRQSGFCFSETVGRSCSIKMVFLKISQNSQENTCTRVYFLISLLALRVQRLWHRCFPVTFPKILKTSFFVEHIRWLLLVFQIHIDLMMLFLLVSSNLNDSFKWENKDIINRCEKLQLSE